MPITTHRRTLADMTVEERFAALAAAEGPPELAYERDPWLAEAQANVEAAVKDLQAAGILDENRKLIPRELPEDMHSGSDQEC